MSAYLFIKNKRELRQKRELLYILHLGTSHDVKAINRQLEEWDREIG